MALSMEFENGSPKGRVKISPGSKMGFWKSKFRCWEVDFEDKVKKKVDHGHYGVRKQFRSWFFDMGRVLNMINHFGFLMLRIVDGPGSKIRFWKRKNQ